MLKINEKVPKVMILIGRIISFRSGFKIKERRVKTKPDKRKVGSPPSIFTPASNEDTRKRARELRIIDRRTDFIE